MTAALLLLGLMAAGPEDIAALFRQARQAEQRQDFAAALEKYNRVLAIDPNLAEVWANKGLVLYELDRHREALRAFEKAAEIKPQLLVPQLFRGMEHLRFGEPQEALAPLGAALQLAPANTQAAYALANAHAELQHFEEAVRLYRDLIQREPGMEQARYALAIAYLNWSKATARTLVDSSSPYGKLLTAEYLAVAGFPEPAEADYLAALKALPQSAEVWSSLQQFYLNQKQSHKAEALAANGARADFGTDALAPAIGHENKRSSADRALYSFSINCRTLARETLLEGVQRNPGSFRAHLLLADLAKSSGENATARAEYENAAASAPDDAEVQLVFIQFLAPQDPSAALEQARRAVAKLPTHPGLNCEVGKLLLKMGSPQEAAVHFRRAIEAEPSLAVARVGLADSYAKNPDLNKAIQEMERVVNADPDGSWHYRLGTWYQATGRTAEAREAFAITTRLKNEQRAREQARFLALTSVVEPGKR